MPRSHRVLLVLAYVALAGALGTLARYTLGQLCLRWFGEDFPWGTLLINCLGSFLFGLVWSLADDRQWLAPEIRVVLLTGFMGAFTTFSTFAFETGRLIEEGRLTAACANVGLEVIVGVFSLFLGLGTGRSL